VESLPDITLINTLDNKVIVKSEGGAAPAAAPGTPAAAPAPQSTQDPRYARMQRPGGAPRPAVVPKAPPAVAAAPPPVLQIAGEGEWKPSGAGEYEITVNDNTGKPQKLLAAIHEDELTLSKGPLALIFNRAQ